MTGIALLDYVATVFAFLCFMVILVRWKVRKDLAIKTMLLIYCFLFILFTGMLIIEWSGYSRAFDPLEDLTGAMLPIIWAIIFYISLHKYQTKKLKESEENLKISNARLTKSLKEIRVINTQLEQAKEKAEENDRLKTAFLANMSHEVRTPMNGIIGFIELLKASEADEDKRSEYMQIIENSSRRLLNIINDLLDISKIEKGQMTLTPAPVDAVWAIKELAVLYEYQAAKKGLKIATYSDPAAGNTVVYADKHKLQRILSNIIDNALKFTESGEITIGYEQEKQGLRFFVSDTGIGIPTDMQEVIFERFRQADTSMTRNYEGTGLGLSISDGLVSLHGSTLKVKSEPGKGSTFYFTLPLVNSSKKQISRSADDVHPEPDIPIAKKVLIAEDDETSFALLKEYLDMLDIQIIHARNGAEAVSLADRHSKEIGMILMDVKMPKMNGMDATRKIKSMHPEIPIVAQTAYAQINEKHQVLEAGCNDFITKPIERKELIGMIRRYLR